MPKGHQQNQQENLKRKRVHFEEREEKLKQEDEENEEDEEQAVDEEREDEENLKTEEIDAVPEEEADEKISQKEKSWRRTKYLEKKENNKFKKKKGNITTKNAVLDEPHQFEESAPVQGLDEDALLQGEEIGEEDSDENEPSSHHNKITPISARPNEKSEDDQNSMHTEEMEEEERRRKIYDLFNQKNTEPIEPFNLKEERTEGYFDDQGTYVWNKNENDDEPDAWVDDYDHTARLDKEMGKAATATAGSSKLYFDVNDTELEKVARLDKKKESSELLSQTLTVDQLREMQLEILHSGENTIKALRRLGGTNNGNKKAGKKGKEKTEEKVENEKNGKNLALLNKLSEVADKLMIKGIVNAYHETREEVEEHLEKSKTRLTNMWEYKWKPEDTKVYGPYEKSQMDTWLKQGYQFYMRKINSNEPFVLA